MGKRFLNVSFIFLSITLLSVVFVHANDNVEPFMQVVDTRAEFEQTQKEKADNSEEIKLSREHYTYNESEDGDTSKNYIKTKYDFNVGESEMTVDFKSFTIKFPSRRQF